MRIGLISDTHLPHAAKELPRQVGEVFAGVDMILHAGDIYDPACLDALERIAPTFACEGNGEYLMHITDPRIERTRVIRTHGLQIGLTHGLAIPEYPPHRTMETVMQHEFGQPVNVVVFGDTHVEEVVTVKGVLCVNPGSPTLPHNLEHILGTVGLLELEEGKAPVARIVRLETLTELNMVQPEKWWTVR